MNNNVFCSRKGGATVDGKFFPLRTSTFLAKQIERKSDEQARRNARRKARQLSRERVMDKQRKATSAPVKKPEKVKVLKTGESGFVRKVKSFFGLKR